MNAIPPPDAGENVLVGPEATVHHSSLGRLLRLNLLELLRVTESQAKPWRRKIQASLGSLGAKSEADSVVKHLNRMAEAAAAGGTRSRGGSGSEGGTQGGNSVRHSEPGSGSLTPKDEMATLLPHGPTPPQVPWTPAPHFIQPPRTSLDTLHRVEGLVQSLHRDGRKVQLDQVLAGLDPLVMSDLVLYSLRRLPPTPPVPPAPLVSPGPALQRLLWRLTPAMDRMMSTETVAVAGDPRLVGTQGRGRSAGVSGTSTPREGIKRETQDGTGLGRIGAIPPLRAQPMNDEERTEAWEAVMTRIIECPAERGAGRMVHSTDVLIVSMFAVFVCMCVSVCLSLPPSLLSFGSRFLVSSCPVL